MSEEGFLQAILEDPGDNANHLVYADWLEEQGGGVSLRKAQFLRLSCAEPPAQEGEEWEHSRSRELQALAATLDTAWLALVSRMRVENCRGKPRPRRAAGTHRTHLPHFEFVCKQRWETLTATEDRAVRFCDDCQKNVYYCDTIQEACEHAGASHCVAVDLGVIRREGDLFPLAMMMLGRPGPDWARIEEERRRPDRVSAAREAHKQAALEDVLTTLRRLGETPNRGVFLQPACTADEILALQRTAVRHLGGEVPRDYIAFLLAANGARIGRAAFRNATALVSDPLDVLQVDIVSLGSVGEDTGFIYHRGARRFQTIQLQMSYARLASHGTFAEMLRAVMREQGVC